MTVRDIVIYDDTIKGIVDDTSIDTLIKFKLLGMCKQFEPIVANFTSIQNDLIVKYGKPGNDGNISISPPNKDDFDNDDDFKKASTEFEESVNHFNKDINKVLDSEVEVEIKKFKSAEVMNAGIPASALLGIWDLIEE